jgi:AcrR family transcriptional regulator
MSREAARHGERCAPDDRRVAMGGRKTMGETPRGHASGEPTRTRATRTSPDARRDQIIEAAAGLLRERSFSDITVKTLQDQLGLSKGGLYHHIKSKDDILFLVCEQAGESMLTALADAEGVEGPARAKLDRLITGHISAVNKYGGALWAFFSERDKLPTDKREHVLRLERDYLQGIVALFRQAQATGEVYDDVDPRLLADALLGMINWFTRWREAQHSGEQLSKTFARIFADATFVETQPPTSPGRTG